LWRHVCRSISANESTQRYNPEERHRIVFIYSPEDGVSMCLRNVVCKCTRRCNPEYQHRQRIILFRNKSSRMCHSDKHFLQALILNVCINGTSHRSDLARH
jgi:hypothetical protein